MPNKSLNIEDSVGFVEPRVGRASIHLGSSHGYITYYTFGLEQTTYDHGVLVFLSIKWEKDIPYMAN